jgi:D-alanyl-D-alanine carboxypeptidase
LRNILIALVVIVALLWGWPGWLRGSSDSTSQSGQTSQAQQANASATSNASKNQSAAVIIPTPIPTPRPTIAPPLKISSGSVPAVTAESIVVIDEASGQVLYGFNEHASAPMASITKIATAIVALEHSNLNDIVKVKYDPEELVDSTAMGCLPGEWYTMEDLLYGLMLPSGNDAALAIANHVAGSKEAFVGMMNDKVKELGLTDTHFANPHGLDEKNHYSSAYDMAMLARYGMTTSQAFRNLAAAKYWDIHGSKSYRIYNLNRLLQNYQYADGVKIGYTDNAGRTTVASATYEGHRVYVAFLHGSDIVNDVVPMFKYAYSNYEWPAACPTAQISTLAKDR